MKIGYVILHGAADWVETDGKSDATLTFSFLPKVEGNLVIGTQVHPLRHGEATVDLRTLRDGEFYPRLETKDGVITVPPITKCETIAAPHPHGTLSINTLLKSCYELESRLTAALSEIKRLTQKCDGHGVFGFEEI